MSSRTTLTNAERKELETLREKEKRRARTNWKADYWGYSIVWAFIVIYLVATSGLGLVWLVAASPEPGNIIYAGILGTIISFSVLLWFPTISNNLEKPKPK